MGSAVGVRHNVDGKASAKHHTGKGVAAPVRVAASSSVDVPISPGCASAISGAGVGPISPMSPMSPDHRDRLDRLVDVEPSKPHVANPFFQGEGGVPKFLHRGSAPQVRAPVPQDGKPKVCNPFFTDSDATPFVQPFAQPRMRAEPIRSDPKYDLFEEDIEVPPCAHKILCDWVRRARYSMTPMLKHGFILEKPKVTRDMGLQLDNWSKIEQLCLMEPEAVIEAQLNHISRALNITQASILEGFDMTVAPEVPAVPSKDPKRPPLPALPAKLPVAETKVAAAVDPGGVWDDRLDAMLDSKLDKQRRRQEMARAQVVAPKENKQFVVDPAKLREEELRRAEALKVEKERLTKLLDKFGGKDVASWHKGKKEDAARKVLEEKLEKQRKLADERWKAQQEQQAQTRKREKEAQRERERAAEQKLAQDRAQWAKEHAQVPAAAKKAKSSAPALDDIFRTLEEGAQREDGKKERVHVSRTEKSVSPAKSERIDSIFDMLGGSESEEEEVGQNVVAQSRIIHDRIENLLFALESEC